MNIKERETNREIKRERNNDILVMIKMRERERQRERDTFRSALPSWTSREDDRPTTCAIHRMRERERE